MISKLFIRVEGEGGGVLNCCEEKGSMGGVGWGVGASLPHKYGCMGLGVEGSEYLLGLA